MLSGIGQRGSLPLDKRHISPNKAAIAAIISGKELPGAYDADWRRLAKIAAHSNVTPLLYLSLRNRKDGVAVPAEVYQSLRFDYKASACRNSIMLEELSSVAGAFSAAGLKAIPLKGAHLLRTVFKDSVGARPMTDIDLLIRESDIAGAVTILGSSGYRYQPAGRSVRATRMYVKSPGAGIPSQIHLHTHIVNLSDSFMAFGARSIDMDDIWAAAVPDAAGLFRMKDEHMLISLCEHGFRHGFARLGLIYDIDACVRFGGGRIDWDCVGSTAARWSMEAPLFHGLSLARLFFGTDVGGALPERLRPRGMSFVEKCAVRSILRCDYPDEKECFLFYLAQNRTLSGKARFLGSCVKARFGSIMLSGVRQ